MFTCYCETIWDSKIKHNEYVNNEIYKHISFTVVVGNEANCYTVKENLALVVQKIVFYEII